jgi:hypothetical protein
LHAHLADKVRIEQRRLGGDGPRDGPAEVAPLCPHEWRA